MQFNGISAWRASRIDSRDTLFADAHGGVSESKRREKRGGFLSTWTKTKCKERDEEREDEVMLIIMEELMTIYIYYSFMTTRSPPRFLSSASLSRPRVRSTATSPANSPSKTSKLSATRVLSDMVSPVQSVLSVFSPRKSSKRSRRWERVNTASTPSWTTGVRPNTGRFFASNIASDLFPSSFFSSS